MNRKRLKEMTEAFDRLKLTVAPEGIEARAEATIATLAAFNAQGARVSLAMIDAAIDKYLEVATDKFMQECALDRLGQATLPHITAENVRSRFWNNLFGLIARRSLVVMGRRSARKK